MLALLFSLEVQPGESSQVLLADSLVDSGSPLDPLTVVVRRVGPPVRLALHVPARGK